MQNLYSQEYDQYKNFTTAQNTNVLQFASLSNQLCYDNTRI